MSIIRSISTINKTICPSINFKHKGKKENMTTDNLVTLAAGIGVTGMIIIATGLACKGNFSKNIAKKGLELKNNILVNKETGEKYTGKIKSNVGLVGFNRVETQSFIDGVLTEKTYKNALGTELEGTFYKDGLECLKVQIGYPYFVPYNKSVAVYRYNQDKTAVEHIDSQGFKNKSVFEWARNFVKEKGWFQRVTN